MQRALLFLAAYLSSACLLLAQELPKQEVPDEASRKQALKDVQDILKAEYTAAKSTEQKLLFANKVLKLATATTNKPPEAFVLFTLSKDVAAQSGDAEAALVAVESMSRVFNTDVYQLKVDAVSTALAARKTPAARLALLPIIDSLIDELLHEDRYDQAEIITSLALATAKESRSSEQSKRFSAKSAIVSRRRAAFGDISNALEVLSRSPADTEANHEVGWYHCVVKGDWEKGISMLALGNHPDIGALAIKSLKGEEPAELGDGWWAVAETLKDDQQENVQSYARRWYRMALPTVAGLAKARVEKRLIREYAWEFKTADSVNAFVPYRFVAGNMDAAEIAPLVAHQPKYKALQLSQGSLIAPIEFGVIRSAQINLILAPGNKHGTTIAVGGLSMLLWSDKCAFRYCFNNDQRNPATETTPGLALGTPHEVLVEEVDGVITVTIDEKRHYTVKGSLAGTCTIVSRATNGVLLLKSVSIRGDGNRTRPVKTPIPINLY